MYQIKEEPGQGNDRYPEYIAEHIKKGTITCALTCKDGVVLAADTRASAGYFIADRHAIKFTMLTDILARLFQVYLFQDKIDM